MHPSAARLKFHAEQPSGGDGVVFTAEDSILPWIEDADADGDACKIIGSHVALSPSESIRKVASPGCT